MRIHLIAIGGSAMHNLALALHHNKHKVSGSDDEIYNPAKDRLAKYGLLPTEMGWHPDKISKDIDIVILGMHARKNNPELLKAKKMKLKIYSYPEFLYEHSKKKTRIVVAGSHGKTTTTSMLMHVLKYLNREFDYLVGAQLEGFETMVRLSDAPIIVIEGDEYLSSPIDLRPKFLHYKPHLAIITGIAWDHINVFPTFKKYLIQFELFIKTIQSKGTLVYYAEDKHLLKMLDHKKRGVDLVGYHAFDSVVKRNKTYIKSAEKNIPLRIFGKHNLENLKAAYHICQRIGITDKEFYEAIKSFKGAAKRLQQLSKTKDAIAFMDFAHAPSKVNATIKALKAQYPDRKLIACLELHTFSSLNKKFLKQYAERMNDADKAYVYFSEHTLKMKKLPPITPDEVKKAFNHSNMTVFTNNRQLERALNRFKWKQKNLLLMSSGTFGGLKLKQLAKQLLQ